MQSRKVQGLRYQLKSQLANRKKVVYVLIGVTVFMITIPQVTQVATRAFWQILLEVTSELIALAIASRLGKSS